MKNIIAALLSLVLTTNSAFTAPLVNTPETVVLGERQFSLSDRYHVASVNEVMKKNILLNFAYLSGAVKSKSDVSWDKIESPSQYSLTLKPGEVFAYHNSVLPEYKDKVVATTNAHFNSTEGFVSDGYLVGDGVCHFASLINWAAQDAGLQVLVTKNHDFAKIEEVPKTYGVSIYVDPTNGVGDRNNLYITNNKSQPVKFTFTYTTTQELNVKISMDQITPKV